MHGHVPINQFSTDTKNTQYYLKKKELNCDTLLTNQINCIYYKSTYNVCTHTYTRTHKEASICVYYIYCGMCVHCPSSSSSRCWSSPLLLRFWLPRQQNTKYKKKKLYFFSLPRSFLLAALYLFGFSACGLVSASVSLASSLACFVHFYAFALFVISLSAISILALSHAVAAVLALSLSPPPLTLPLIIHWTNDCAPLCPTHTHTHKNTSLFFTTPLFTLLTLSLHTLWTICTTTLRTIPTA